MPTSAGEWLRDVDFWRQLTDKHRKQYVDVTQPPPMDRSGGLLDIHSTLWRHDKLKKVFLMFVLVVKISLNLSTSFSGGQLAEFPWRTSSGFTKLVDFPNQANASTDLVDVDGQMLTVLKICWHSSWHDVNSLGAQENTCLTRSAEGLGFVARITFFVEQIVIGTASLAMTTGFVMFVVLGKETFLREHSSLFIRVPRFLGTFSLVKLLRYVNPTLLKRLPDDALYLFIQHFGGGFLKDPNKQKRVKVGQYLFTLVLICFCLVLSVGALVVNIVKLFWIAAQDYDMWNRGQVIQLAAFLNRLAGIIDVDELEIDRLFLFRYGGADAKWQAMELYKRRTYWSLMMEKISHGKFVRSGQERLNCWITLATFRSDDVQKLWLSNDSERQRTDPVGLSAEVQAKDIINHPLFWPPRGSDPQYSRKNPFKNGVEVENPLPGLMSSAGKDQDLRMSFFLENMQSYRLWLENSREGTCHFYDHEGNLSEISENFAEEAVQPRIHQLSDMIDEILQENQANKHSRTAQQLDLALKLQVEIEDLMRMGERSQGLAKLPAGKRHDALPPRSLAMSARASLTNLPMDHVLFRGVSHFKSEIERQRSSTQSSTPLHRGTRGTSRGGGTAEISMTNLGTSRSQMRSSTKTVGQSERGSNAAALLESGIEEDEDLESTFVEPPHNFAS